MSVHMGDKKKNHKEVQDSSYFKIRIVVSFGGIQRKGYDWDGIYGGDSMEGWQSYVS